MKVIIFTALLLSQFSLAANSRIRSYKTCSQDDKLEDGTLLHITYKIEMYEECNNFAGPSHLECREGISVDLADAIGCFRYIPQSTEEKTQGGRTIKRMKNLEKIDSRDCQFVIDQPSETLYCSNLYK